MIRKVIIVSLGLVLLGGIYVSRYTLETAWALTLTARDVLFASEQKDKPTTSTADQGRPEVRNVFAKKFSISLMTMDDGTPRSFEASKLAGVKYWAFYYAAASNSASRTFTPNLVSFYRDFKLYHPDFEIIFIDLDASEDDMLNFMRNDSMSWPAIWYNDINNPELEARKYLKGDLPCLVLVDGKGRVLSETSQGTEPGHVIDDIRAIVK